jgi:predicted RNase H-like HicB family nuclease
MRFKIILKEDEEVGGFIASCPGLPGCFSQGDTVEEAIDNIKKQFKRAWNLSQRINAEPFLK